MVRRCFFCLASIGIAMSACGLVLGLEDHELVSLPEAEAAPDAQEVFAESGTFDARTDIGPGPDAPPFIFCEPYSPPPGLRVFCEGFNQLKSPFVSTFDGGAVALDNTVFVSPPSALKVQISAGGTAGLTAPMPIPPTPPKGVLCSMRFQRFPAVSNAAILAFGFTASNGQAFTAEIADEATVMARLVDEASGVSLAQVVLPAIQEDAWTYVSLVLRFEVPRLEARVGSTGKSIDLPDVPPATTVRSPRAELGLIRRSTTNVARAYIDDLTCSFGL